MKNWNQVLQKIDFNRYTIGSFVLGCVLVCWFFLHLSLGEADSTAKANVNGSNGVGSTESLEKEDTETLSIEPETVDFAWFIERWKAAGSLQESYALLQELRRRILGMDPTEAVKLIVEFLQTHEDVETQLGFVVGPDGVMETVPTLRAALMDLLAQVDPYAAVDVAREIVADRADPDEYSLALRNLAWFDLGGDMVDEVSRGFEEMLNQSDWLANPTPGFLEAFDMAVFAGDQRSIENLASVMNLQDSNGNLIENGVGRAAFMALDRLTLRDPEGVLSLLKNDLGLLSHAPEQRASLLARLDVRNLEQEKILRDYLGSNLSNEEFEQFASRFPLQNFTIGNRLVTTQEPTSTMRDVDDIDNASLAWVESQLSNTSDQRVKSVMTKLQKRLQEYVREGSLRGQNNFADAEYLEP